MNDDMSEILNHYSSYPYLSKKTYRPNLYYDQYCDLPITLNVYKLF